MCLAVLFACASAQEQGVGTKTATFTTMDGFYQGDPQTESASTMIGMGVGFSVTGLFFIYAAANIIIDERRRMAKALKRVEKAKKKLVDDFDYSQGGIELLNKKF